MKIGPVTENIKEGGGQKQFASGGITFLWGLKYVRLGNISVVFPEL
jgi:hypothetical protein